VFRAQNLHFSPTRFHEDPDLRGNARIVWEQQGTLGNESAGTSGIPSPDGRHLAMMGFTQSANMWVIEGF